MNVKCIVVGNIETNCYLVWQEGREDCAVIDPGGEPERIRLTADGLGKKIVGILLTHGHFDHVTGVKGLKSPEIPVYLHEADTRLPLWLSGGKPQNTHTYGQGDEIRLAGLEFTVLHTPGHTPGSVCLMAEDILFTGDTLFSGACGRTDLPGGNWADMERSLARLAALPGDRSVYPGHGGGSTLERERRENPYMKRCLHETDTEIS